VSGPLHADQTHIGVEGITMAGSIRELLASQVDERPEVTAVVEGSASYTWAQLDELSAAFALRLRDRGIGAGNRLVLLAKNSAAFFIALFAASMLDAVAVPLNSRLSVAELSGMLADTRATVVVVDEEFEMAAQVLADGNPDRIVLTKTLTEPGDQAVDRTGLPAGAPRPDEIALQMYTSGTTGVPRGAMFSHSNIKMVLENVSPLWARFQPGDVSIVCMPLFHMGGLAWALAGMAGGATSLTVRDFDPSAVLEICSERGVTTAFFVPAMLTALLGVADEGRPDLRLRHVSYAGSPIAPSTLLAAMKTFNCEFVQLYGMTEATGAFAQLDPEDHEPDGARAHLLRSAGRAYPWAEVKVVDTSTGEYAGRRVSGEIWTRSAQNFAGYFGRPEETAAALTSDGWLRTGDIGLIDDEGYIFLLDRKKDMIISGGENVYPAEVEVVLADHPAVLDVAVIGVPSDRWGETVKAVVVPRPGQTVNPEELIAFARSRVAAFKCPTSVDVVTALPRTSTGKIRKNVLRAPYWSDQDRQIH